jgi:hypothetical protein
VQEFQADKYVTGFATQLREEFHETLKIAVSCARSYSPRGFQAPVVAPARTAPRAKSNQSKPRLDNAIITLSADLNSWASFEDR